MSNLLAAFKCHTVVLTIAIMLYVISLVLYIFSLKNTYCCKARTYNLVLSSYKRSLHLSQSSSNSLFPMTTNLIPFLWVFVVGFRSMYMWDLTVFVLFCLIFQVVYCPPDLEMFSNLLFMTELYFTVYIYTTFFKIHSFTDVHLCCFHVCLGYYE